MFELLSGLIELCFFTIWGIVGVVAGLLAAAGVWHFVDHESRASIAAITYVVVFVLCIIIGHGNEDKK